MSTFAVLGATGRMGGATARALLREGASVRAITRHPGGPPSLELAEAGAEIAEADMASVDALAAAFDGVDGVFNVQPAFDGRGRHDAALEVKQGTNVAEAIRRASVPHVVYGAAGTGTPSGIPHFDTKLDIEAALRAACPRVTVLRPAPFMELLTDAAFAPALSTWGAEPKVMGWDTPIPWVATVDIGAVAATTLLHPDALGGRELHLAADIVSLREARALVKAVTGRSPRRIPIPGWLFSMLVGDELPRMWAFMRDHRAALKLDPATLHTIHPSAMTVEQWLHQAHAADRA